MNKMVNITTLAIALFSVANVAAKNTASVSEGDVINVALSEFSPTQPSIGYDQVFYKLGRFETDKKKMFDEICEANGQQGLVSFNAQSDVHVPQTFECKEPVGTFKKEMKTVVIAPDGNYYLTDGHHTFNVFWTMLEGGRDLKVNVVVDKDYRNLESMERFWNEMIVDGNTWLFSDDGQQISYNELPKSLGLDNFANDQYRSLMYFSRDVGWNKPKSPIPFLEFYWTKEVRKQIDIAQLNLSDKAGYADAITKVSHVILALESENVGLSGKSSKQMGKYEQFNQKGLDKLLRDNKGKVSYMINYKSTL